MADTTQSPVHVKQQQAFALHRSGIASVDTLPITKAAQPKTTGINMAGYEEAIIEVLPAVGADPIVTIYWWSDAFDGWVRDHTLTTFAAVGAGVEWQAVVACKHRRMFVALTGTLTGGVDVRVAGHRNVIEGM